ncbi:MAG: PEGA domain-containing protein [Deltaproteobacteria bacterium]|nr:PEGA domain-containing protein [Deltaproteobacteria bacterium]
MLVALAWIIAAPIVVEPSQPGAEVLIDGTLCPGSPCERDVVPGLHEVIVRHVGFEQRRLTVEVEGGQQQTVRVLMFAAPTIDEARERTAWRSRVAAWTLLSGAAALTISGFVLRFGVGDPLTAALQRDIAAYNAAPWDQTSANANAINARIERLSAIDRAAIASWAIAGAAALSSVALFVFAPSPKGKATVSLAAAPGPGGGFASLTLHH